MRAVPRGVALRPEVSARGVGRTQISVHGGAWRGRARGGRGEWWWYRSSQLPLLHRVCLMRDGGGTGGLSAVTMREIASAIAVAMLASRKPQERAAGAYTLARIDHDVGLDSNRKLVEYQEAMVAAGGVGAVNSAQNDAYCYL